MADDDLNYQRMIEDAKRGVVSKALAHVVERGFPGDHHFYITFRTGHPDVVMPDHLRAHYPSEITIVLQHQFSDLEVGPDAFAVTLSFSNSPERLTVPFESVVAFADPSVQFGLQFDLDSGAGKPGETERIFHIEATTPEAEATNLEYLTKNRKSIVSPDAVVAPPESDPDKVVALDAFRKIDGLHKK